MTAESLRPEAALIQAHQAHLLNHLEVFADTVSTPSQAQVYYCPGCNRSPDDYAIPSVGCLCATHGSGSGSLTAEQMDNATADKEDA